MVGTTARYLDTGTSVHDVCVLPMVIFWLKLCWRTLRTDCQPSSFVFNVIRRLKTAIVSMNSCAIRARSWVWDGTWLIDWFSACNAKGTRTTKVKVISTLFYLMKSTPLAHICLLEFSPNNLYLRQDCRCSTWCQRTDGAFSYLINATCFSLLCLHYQLWRQYVSQATRAEFWPCRKKWSLLTDSD